MNAVLITNNMRNRFKSNLRYLMKENNITSKQLADIIGIDYRKIFSHKVHLEKVDKISVLFMVNSYDLIYGSVKKSHKIMRDIPLKIKSDKQTMESVMQFFKIIHNYKKINSLFLDSIIFEKNPFNLQMK